jgi:hypothetical protein
MHLVQPFKGAIPEPQPVSAYFNTVATHLYFRCWALAQVFDGYRLAFYFHLFALVPASGD